MNLDEELAAAVSSGFSLVDNPQYGVEAFSTPSASVATGVASSARLSSGSVTSRAASHGLPSTTARGQSSIHRGRVSGISATSGIMAARSPTLVTGAGVSGGWR